MALEYEPLDVHSYEIRMLTILPGPPESTVKCTMDKTNLISPVSYAALSYCWGYAALATDIFVNGTRTPVTTNLADALRHLRKLGVGRVWADALCINQADKQEKGLQIRHMQHIYSRADVTYGWLGREDVDGATAAITFLMSLLNSHDPTALAPAPHTCVSTPRQRRQRRQQWPRSILTSAQPLSHQTRSEIEVCRRCTTEASFQGLQHLLQRQYWKRRWIIQETSVSYQHLLLCGDAGITLDEMDQAITTCQRSCYWDLGIKKLSAWFQTITEFRRFQQKETRPSLCQAIALSRQFESTDPRDAIFSLLGLCNDGPELVPIPNYLQPIEAIVTDLTRALIRKHKHLDFLLINGTNRTSSGVLPSWVPDWLSGDIPSQAYDLAAMTTRRAETRFCLGDSLGQNPLKDGKVLQVKGLTVGRIATMTSTTNPMDVSLLCSGQSTSSVSLFDSQTSVHYTDCQVFTALLSCFTLTPEGQHQYFTDHLWKFDSLHFNARVIWHTFCLQCVPPQTKFSQHSQTSIDSETPKSRSKRILLQWLKANAKFQIHGRTLEEWTQERTSSCWTTVMRILDSTLSIPFMILLLLVPLCPLIALSILFIFVITKTLLSFLMFQLFWASATFALFIVLFSEGQLLSGYRYKIEESKRLWNDLTQLVEPGKKLFVADKGYIGIADDRVNIGDMLCNLVGCSEPVVLREMGGDRDGNSDGASPRRKTYAVVGKCYVHFTERESDQYLGPDPFYRDSTTYEEEKEKWMSNPAKGTLEEFYLI